MFYSKTYMIKQQFSVIVVVVVVVVVVFKIEWSLR